MILLIDGGNLLHRMYHGMPPLTKRDGTPTEMAYGLSRKLIELIRVYEPTHAVFAWDTRRHFSPRASRTSTPVECEHGYDVCPRCDPPEEGYFRNLLYPPYKANRRAVMVSGEAPMSDSLAASVRAVAEAASNKAVLDMERMETQLPDCRKVVDALGFHWIDSDGHEADDVIATVVRQAEADRWPTLIVSSDKDLRQLCRQSWVQILDPMTSMLLDVEKGRYKFGFGPELLPTYYALVGDTCDNLPGVPGIGPVAAKALCQVGDLETIYRCLDDGTLLYKLKHIDGGVSDAAAKRYVKLLAAQREQAQLMLKLVTLDASVSHVPPLDKLRRVPRKRDDVRALWRSLEFQRMSLEDETVVLQVGRMF